MIPRFSVVIPSFNKVNYIEKTLKSIFDQRYKNLEVIIQDGGSTDGTIAIIHEYIKRYPKSIVFESKRDSGQLDAVNKGLKKATGEVLTFINADDYYEKGAFKKIAQAYSKYPNSNWFTGKGRVVNEHEKEIAKIFTLYKNFLLRLNSNNFILVVNYLTQPSVFFTYEAYKKYGPFAGTNAFIMEYDFWLRLSMVNMPVVVNSLISNFRIEDTTKTKQMFNRILTEDEKIVSRFTSNTLIMFLHKIHNLGRKIIVKFV